MRAGSALAANPVQSGARTGRVRGGKKQWELAGLQQAATDCAGKEQELLRCSRLCVPRGMSTSELRHLPVHFFAFPETGSRSRSIRNRSLSTELPSVPSSSVRQVHRLQKPQLLFTVLVDSACESCSVLPDQPPPYPSRTPHVLLPS